ncbi:MAG: RNA polymerase sigma factor RpoD/SigA [Armatimonadetes bacterium]|nr:MAG: RNA polymerase sigma factor RpoD/SigA [Armatimonadota bacterium]
MASINPAHGVNTNEEPRESAELPSYLARLTRKPVLSSAEEEELFLKAKAGDEEARKELVECNMRLVVSVAKNYKTPNLSLEDLVQEGAIGLLKAVDKFEPSYGYRFSTYAMHWIRQAIGRAIDSKSKVIRLPAHIRETLRKIERGAAALQAELGREPSLQELAKHLCMKEKKILKVLNVAQDTLSLEGIGTEETDLLQVLPDPKSPDPESTVIRQEERTILQRALKELTPRERHALGRRIGLDIEEDGTISKHQRRQDAIRAIQKLRAIAERHRLREFFDR